MTVWIDGLYRDDGRDVGDWRDPCPDGCSLVRTCRENEDVAVALDLVVMRRARQGFFDAAADFDDIFCSAKLDTCRPDANDDGIGEPMELLFDPDDGTRSRTAVLAVACTASPDGASSEVTTTLHASAATVSCTLGGVPVTFAVDPTRGPGTAEAASLERDDGDAPRATLSYATYWGTEALDCGRGASSCNKVYWNLALDVGELAEDGLVGCTIRHDVTATDGSGEVIAHGIVVGSGTSYPVIHVEDALDSCEQNPLDGPGSDVTTVYCTTGDLSPARACPPLCHTLTQGTAGPVTDAACHTCVEGAACDDNDRCTVDDACVVGRCLGTPVDCRDVAFACRDRNLAALGAVATASSEHVSGQYGAARAIDGDPATEWIGAYCEGCRTNELTVTLAEPSRLVGYELVGPETERNIVEHALAYEDDEGDWVPIIVTPTTPRPGAFSASFQPIVARRVRVSITAADNPIDQTVLFELSLVGQGLGCDPGCASWNVAAAAAGATASASSLHQSGDFPAALAIDGDPDTFWVSEYCTGESCSSAQLVVDFGGPRVVSSFVVHGLDGDDDPTLGADLEREVGGAWVPLPYTSSRPPGAIGDQAGTFAPVTTSRLRVTVHTWVRPEPVQVQVYEVEVFGWSPECEPTCIQDLCNPETGACDVPVDDEACVEAPSCVGSNVCVPGCEGTPCDDGDACTTGDLCQGTTCVGGANPCDDQDPCTTNACDAGVCAEPVWTCATTTQHGVVFETLPALGGDGLFHTAGRNVPVNGNNGFGDLRRVGRSYALASSDLSVAWGPVPNHASCATNNGVSMPALSDELGRVFVQGDWNDGTPSGTDFCASIFAKSAADGAAIWDRQPTPSPHPHPRHPIALGATHAFYGGYNGNLNRFRLSDGVIDASMSLSGGGSSGGSIVLLASGDVVASQHGLRTRRFTPDGTIVWTSTAITNDLYVTAADQIVGRNGAGTTIVMIDGATGGQRWSQPAPQVYGAILTDTAGNLYYGELGAIVSRAADGVLRWTLSLAGNVEAQFLGDDGRLYARTAASLYALDTADGAVRWRFDAVAGTVSIEGQSVANRFGGPFALLANGDIFGSDYAGRWYRLSTAGLGYAPSVWARGRGDRSNSGRARVP